MENQWYVHVTTDENGYVENIIDSQETFVKSAFLLDNYYGIDNGIKCCKVEESVADENNVQWYTAVMDEEKYVVWQKEREIEMKLKYDNEVLKKEEEEKIEVAQRMFTPMLMRMATPLMADEEVEDVLPILPMWEVGKTYKQGEIVKHKGLAYRTVPEQVIAQEHQPPDGTGLLAVYRPLSPNQDIADGSKEKPYEFTEGMDVFKDKYYTYEGKLYTPDRDVPNCTYYPGQVGVHFWLLVEDEAEGNDLKESMGPEEPIEPTIKEWEQPLGAHDAYAVGMKVTYQGKTWENSHPNNTYVPGVYGWKVISG